MAGNKKPRKKTSLVKRRSNHIKIALDKCLSKFHLIGDVNHRPKAFHYADLSMYLKGTDLKVGYQLAQEYLLVDKRPWTLIVYHFFKTETGIEIVPATIVVKDTDLIDMGNRCEDLFKDLRESVYQANEGLNDANLAFYGYYLTYGDNLLVESIEENICNGFFKLTNDLADVTPNVVRVTSDKLIQALAEDKYHLSNRDALSTNMVYQETV